MGHFTKNKVDNTDKRVTLLWANAKTKEQCSDIAKKRTRPNPQLIEHDIKNYH
jgi:hypothetical protein